MLPTTFEVFLTKDAVFETRETMEWRVVGGTMSTRAAMRSNSVSSAESSEDTEDSDSLEDVRDDEVEAYGLLPLSSFSSMISTLTMVRANSVIFVTLCDLSLLSAPPTLAADQYKVWPCIQTAPPFMHNDRDMPPSTSTTATTASPGQSGMPPPSCSLSASSSSRHISQS